MNVRTLCLAILSFGESTGYEIKKQSVEGKFSYFVDASFGSIYPALARLEADGFVTSRQEIQPGKPPRKIYEITEAGRTALVEELSEPPGRDVFRSEFLLIAMCAKNLPQHVVTEAIESRIRSIEEEVGQLRHIVEELDDEAAIWTAQYGVTCKAQALENLKKTRGDLEKLAGSRLSNTTTNAAE
ncbi:PadR family transcriptional regulator [Rhodobium gokarnense]|uniref:DNA-binding PadR family transcriptional regulator n=1 Tax=Rhodobium gokarnense TaxID=364296 RepID=A0ABT3HAP0_9HYPH|nr:PadR family transcriptional regulator [Rhodobium gokarnense]MCW2307445.1 DNA-binding PadR family transcriptional regulator [Rhodobium gokarnense]